MSIIKIIIILLICFFVGFAWITPCHKHGFFEVREGDSLFQIAKNLEDKGFIQTELSLYFYVLVQDKSQELKSGVYSFSVNDTFFSIASKIIAGETNAIKITIPEGFNLRQIDTRLAKVELISQEERFVDFCLKNSVFSVAGLKLEGLEGFLFPDTYYIGRQVEINDDAQNEKIVRMMLDNFDKKLTQELREEIKIQNKTIFEIITMASLIEKEVRGFKDKEIVSGILWKRLKIGMPLQVDATVAYITGKNTVKISRKELQIDSPYNTYKYRGLPKGPICNPGIESIITAIHPIDNPYWYYLSTPEGETIFSETLDEHNIAKVKYLK